MPTDCEERNLKTKCHWWMSVVIASKCTSGNIITWAKNETKTKALIYRQTKVHQSLLDTYSFANSTELHEKFRQLNNLFPIKTL